jgi:D-glycero-alpha-D-manno-heptose-7-phosphate kinase
MIITKTPYRISFFGGGTDYHTWYQENGGEVLSATINHYNYLSLRYLPPFNKEYINRIAWSILEYPKTTEDIQHPAVRAALKYYNVKNGVEISAQSDLPAHSGLGSSSSFSAGLIKAIYALEGKMLAKDALAAETINLERNILKENVGVQDQIAVVYGGLNKIVIHNDGSFFVEPIIISEERKKQFNENLLLFFTGLQRMASDICKTQIELAKSNGRQLKQMQSMVSHAVEILTNEKADLNDFGKMLNETWKIKRNLSNKISCPHIDDIYALALKNGAIGGKLLGAGAGGFMLFFAEPQKHALIKKALKNLIFAPFEFENQGASIVLYAPKNFSQDLYYRNRSII